MNSNLSAQPAPTAPSHTAAVPVTAAQSTLVPRATSDCASVERRLDEVEELLASLEVDAGYAIPKAPFTIPADFKLTVIIPVYNERRTIARVIARVGSIPLPLQVIVVDDYSTDGTAGVLDGLVTAVSDLQVIHHGKNGGKGAALRTGFQHATGTVVVVQDADMEYDPCEIPDLIRPIMEDEADVVYGSRFLENGAIGSSFTHQLGNRALTWLSNLTTGLQLTDMETCYKAFRRECLEGLELRENRFGIEPELTAKIARRDFRIQELPISYHARKWDEGKKIGLRDGLHTLYCIARYSNFFCSPGGHNSSGAASAHLRSF